VLAPAPDQFPNNIGLSCKFRAGAVAKYVFYFAPETGTPGSCVPRFQDFEHNFASPLPRVRFGFETGAKFSNNVLHIRTLYSHTLFLVLQIFYFYLHFCKYRGATSLVQPTVLYSTLEALESIDRYRREIGGKQ
jgi:hypothetical protein